MLRTLARTVTLAAASAVTAEFLLGDQYLTGFASAGQQIFMLVLFMIFYGSGAILIREIARKAGRGWPTILLLALAFGVLEEGLLTQSLFNPNYAGAHLLAFGYIDWLGTSGPWLVFVLTLHVVWSIGSPIAVAEALFSSHRPWLGRAGLIVTPILFVLGAAAIFALSAFTDGFFAAWWQLAASAVVAIVLIVVALRTPRASIALAVLVISALRRRSAALSMEYVPSKRAAGLSRRVG